jgi:cytolysin-activating lysine-acyltransferase
MMTKPSSFQPRAQVSSQPLADALPAQDLEALKRLADQQAQKVLSKVPLLGPVTWLMMQQAAGRHTLLGELEWRVMPALLLDQAKLYLRGSAPVAYASWARLDNAAAERYRTAPHQLAAADWASGTQVWLIDVFTPFGGAAEVLQDLREKVFAGQAVHQLLPVAPGRPKVLTWPSSNRAQ